RKGQGSTPDISPKLGFTQGMRPFHHAVRRMDSTGATRARVLSNVPSSTFQKDPAWLGNRLRREGEATMCKPGLSLLAIVIALPPLTLCGPAAAQTNKAPAASADEAFIRQNEALTKEWPTIGLDYAETRFSKLKQIDDS